MRQANQQIPSSLRLHPACLYTFCFCLQLNTYYIPTFMIFYDRRSYLEQLPSGLHSNVFFFGCQSALEKNSMVNKVAQQSFSLSKDRCVVFSWSYQNDVTTYSVRCYYATSLWISTSFLYNRSDRDGLGKRRWFLVGTCSRTSLAQSSLQDLGMNFEHRSEKRVKIEHSIHG